MIEVLIVWQLSKAIGRIAAAKGRSVGGYRALLILLWLGCEIGAGAAGVVAGLDGAPVYLLAIAGAIAGAITAFVIAKSVAPLTPLGANARGGFPVIQSPPRY